MSSESFERPRPYRRSLPTFRPLPPENPPADALPCAFPCEPPCEPPVPEDRELSDPPSARVSPTGIKSVLVSPVRAIRPEDEEFPLFSDAADEEADETAEEEYPFLLDVLFSAPFRVPMASVT